MIYETYSERHRTHLPSDDVYQYDEVPQRLRVQVQQILRDAIGPHEQMTPYAMQAPRDNAQIWEFIHKTLCREFGVHSILAAQTEGQEVIAFLAICSTAQFIDVVELCVRVIHRELRRWSAHERKSHGIEMAADDALEEINHRFRKSGFGYQFIDDVAIRVDSEFAHKEIVIPAFRILSADGYEGCRDEFLSAHRHYRNGDHEEAITEAAKSFESMMKAICDQKGWAYPKGARASDLLKVLRTNRIWPDYLDASFDQLIATLASGLPQVRNDSGAHGQGALRRETPSYVAAYAIHLAASKIILMAEAATTIPDAMVAPAIKETV